MGASFPGAPTLIRGTEDSSPMSFQQSVAPPQSLRGSEGDTSKVLQELERVRHGIQVFTPCVAFSYVCGLQRLLYALDVDWRQGMIEC